MATATLTADTSTARIQDPVSFDEASLLFAETGLPVSARSLLRWAKEDGIPLSRRGRAWVASYSDLLVAHAARHPAPGR
ncbi:hypothetical protein ACGFZS_47130 [Streptomyces sp. NPDC048288]|uniref:hypothetical protein n=1 Tax=Streptomyces sp. NPDC048288 TaxID=3365529 RepID=UPI00370F7D16